MKYKTITYTDHGFTVDLTIEKKTALDGKQWFCIIRKDVKTVVAKFKLQRDAVWHLDNFDKFPILPI